MTAPTMTREERKYADRLNNALLGVARATSSNRDAIEEALRAGWNGKDGDTVEGLREILDALDEWGEASRAMIAAVKRIHSEEG